MDRYVFAPESTLQGRQKDGKEHRYWSIVESKRCAGGKVVQRQVLYLGEINDSQQEACCTSCRKTFNPLTGTPLAGLHHQDRWPDQAQALIAGETVANST
ncbi:MAG: hypothetical protein ACLQJR_23165, partial [Stellaceae bacterium]